MDIKKYVRKPFVVEAVQVTEENIAEVADWCEGKIVNEDNDHAYIKVKTYRPMNRRQSQAFINDWVLKTTLGFKVYVDDAFGKTFVEQHSEVVS